MLHGDGTLGSNAQLKFKYFTIHQIQQHILVLSFSVMCTYCTFHDVHMFQTTKCTHQWVMDEVIVRFEDIIQLYCIEDIISRLYHIRITY